MREHFRVTLAGTVKPEGILFDERLSPIYNAHFRDSFRIHQIEIFKDSGVAKSLCHTPG
jgi:hypothetical protein